MSAFSYSPSGGHHQDLTRDLSLPPFFRMDHRLCSIRNGLSPLPSACRSARAPRGVVCTLRTYLSIVWRALHQWYTCWIRCKVFHRRLGGTLLSAYLFYIIFFFWRSGSTRRGLYDRRDSSPFLAGRFHQINDTRHGIKKILLRKSMLIETVLKQEILMIS